MLYLALSCFQGRRMCDAAETLLNLAPGGVGLQLTPGCAPTPLELSCAVRTHHGYTPKALRARVWERGELVWQGDSVHPPLRRNVPDGWTPPDDLVMETMYPGYAALSNGDQIEAAMDAGRSLAVDVAHLGIQMFHGVLRENTLRRILDYDHVAEIHVSTSEDARDSHARITNETWGVDWARERLAELPVILECYMHKLTNAERLEQVRRLLS